MRLCILTSQNSKKANIKLANKKHKHRIYLFLSRSHKKTLTLTAKNFIIQTLSFGQRTPRVYRVGDNNISALWIYKLNLTFMFCLYVENKMFMIHFNSPMPEKNERKKVE